MGAQIECVYNWIYPYPELAKKAVGAIPEFNMMAKRNPARPIGLE